MPFKKPHEMRPGNRYARELGTGRTLGQLAANKMALAVVCRRCKHRRVLYPASLIERFGADYPSIEIRQHLRCSQCRYRSANVHEMAR